ncbi:MAG: substrate-binding domain-containing protein, partial [Gemmatimonadaceae bacterium]
MSRFSSCIRFASVAAIAWAGACGGSSKPASGGTRATAADASLPSTFTIALIAKSSTNPVFLSGRIGAEAAAAEQSKKLGITIKIDWLTPPEEDAQVQAQRVAQAVDAGDNAILMSTSDANKVTDAINAAVARGVPVMMFDSDAPNSKRFSFYGGDDEAIGRQVMDELAVQMDSAGNIAILAGNQNAPNLQKRVQGVKDAATQYPRIHILNTFYHRETPQDAAAEVMRASNAYPNIQGWAMIGGWALWTKAL